MRYNTFKSKCQLFTKRFKKILEDATSLGELETLNTKQTQKVQSLYEEAKIKNTDIVNSLNAFFEFDDLDPNLNETELDIITNVIFDLFIEIESVLKPLVSVGHGCANDNDSLSDYSSVSHRSSNHGNSQIKLPNLQLKEFDGDMSQWTA